MNMNRELGFEKKEDLQFATRVIARQDLVEKIYQGEPLLRDERFLPTEQGGVFGYFDLDDLRPLSGGENKFFPIAEINNEIAGLAELEVDPYKDKNLWIKFVSVDPKYQGHGCASKLVQEMFEFAKNQGCSLEESLRSPEGEIKLKRLIRESAEKFHVKLILHA
jgi:GNAT superfamily N-acetyltransferase